MTVTMDGGEDLAPDSDLQTQESGLPGSLVGKWSLDDGSPDDPPMEFDGTSLRKYEESASYGKGYCEQDYSVVNVSNDGTRGTLELAAKARRPFFDDSEASVGETQPSCFRFGDSPFDITVSDGKLAISSSSGNFTGNFTWTRVD